MSRYLVKIDNKEYDLHLEYRADGYEVSVDGAPVRVTNHRLGETRSVLLVENRSFEVDVRSNGLADSKTVFMLGVEIPVEIEEYQLAQLRKTAGMKSGPSVEKKLKAPMPGLILEVKVASGDKVSKDQPLIVIEAMKMENVIKASGDAVVKSVDVSKGASVEKGDQMLEFE